MNQLILILVFNHLYLTLIFQINIKIIFYGGVKVYNTNRIPGPITYVINNDLSNNYTNNYTIYESDYTIYEPDLSIDSYSALFRTKDAGNRYIDFDNIVLKTKNSYAYIIAPVNPLYSTIYPYYLTFTFFGGSKIYDSTIFTGLITFTISGIFTNDIVYLSSYNSFFNN